MSFRAQNMNMLTPEQMRALVSDAQAEMMSRINAHAHVSVPMSNGSTFTVNSHGDFVTRADVDDGSVHLVDFGDESKPMRPEPVEREPNLREVWAD